MESWRFVWRRALAALLSTPALEALAVALETGDKRLLQGATTSPPPLQCTEEWPVEGACPIGFAGVVDCGGWDTALVSEVEEYFAKCCYDLDRTLGEPAACRWFLNAWDETPREQIAPALLAEVRRTLAIRRGELADDEETPPATVPEREDVMPCPF